MRPDMSKVITECYRDGTRYDGRLHNPVRKAKRVRLDFDISEGVDVAGVDEFYTGHSPSTSMKPPKSARKVGRKRFTDNLNPLFRFLKSCVGRPWNDVHSEISEHIKASSTTQIHVLGHVKDVVAVNTFLGEDGKVYDHGNGFRWRDAPVSEYYGRGGQFPRLYVDPTSGILRSAKKVKREYSQPYWYTPSPKIVFGEDNLAYTFIDDTCYRLKCELITQEMLDKRAKRKLFGMSDTSEQDVFYGASIYYGDLERSVKEAVTKYGRPIFIKSKEYASHAEINRYRIRETCKQDQKGLRAL